MADELKKQIHDHIQKADLKQLKTSVDQVQKSFLTFDDPSLLILAIEVYLDPLCIINEEYQMEVIMFLIKCGVKVWVPGGNVLLHVFNWSEDKQVHTDEEFEEKLKQLCEVLINNGQSHILNIKLPELPTIDYFRNLQGYLTQQWAAFKIQNFWRRWRQTKPN